MQFLRSIKKGTLQVGIAPHKKSWAIPQKRLSASIFGIFYRPDERRAGAPDRALELANQRGKHEVEGWRIRKNGTPFFITGSVSSNREDAGNLLGFINILRDATERRDAEEKLVQAREQLAMSQKME